MTKGLFALLMAGSLMVPAHHPRAGKRKHRRPAAHGNRCARAHPGTDYRSRRPHLDTMPWLNSGSAKRGPKMDILLGPQLETVGPFLVQPSILATQVWSDLRPRETGIAAQ
jgi:hypothetical protein